MSETKPQPKIITRPSLADNDVQFQLLSQNFRERVNYTSGWQPVVGAKDVVCRTWTVQNKDASQIDGADLIIEAGGFTPIQLVKSARVVIDAPESGEVYCCVLDKAGKTTTYEFSERSPHQNKQMVWEEGTIIWWGAKSKTRITEFESPSFNDEMFVNISEGTKDIDDRDLTEFLEKVVYLKAKINTDS